MEVWLTFYRANKPFCANRTSISELLVKEGIFPDPQLAEDYYTYCQFQTNVSRFRFSEHVNNEILRVCKKHNVDTGCFEFAFSSYRKKLADRENTHDR
jgi:hypothetical protein